MVYKCCVTNCRGNYVNGPKVNMFSFPTEKNMKLKWLRAIQRDFTPTKHSKVCIQHFQTSDVLFESSHTDERTGITLTAPLKKPRLNRKAVPSIFHGYQAYLKPGKNKKKAALHKRQRLVTDTGNIAIAKNSLYSAAAKPILVHKAASAPFQKSKVRPPSAAKSPTRFIVKPDVYNLQWAEYSTKFSGSFASFWKAQDLVDVTLGVEGRYIQAHKLVLSVCSDYFRDLFKFNPCQHHPIVILKDMDYESINAIVQFMYCGEVQVTADKLPTLLRIAQQLKVKGLTNGEVKPEKITTVYSGSTSAMTKTRENVKTSTLRNAATTTSIITPPNNPSSKRTRYTFPSNVEVKILRRSPPKTIIETFNAEATEKVVTFPQTNHNFINMASTSNQDFTIVLDNPSVPTTLVKKERTILEQDPIEMKPIKLEHDSQNGEFGWHEFEFVDGLRQVLGDHVADFKYETIQESLGGGELDLRL